MKETLKGKLKEGLTIEEAIENLITIAEMDLDAKTPVGILKDTKITTKQEDFAYKEIEWLFPEDPLDFLEHVKPSYRTCLQYLKAIFHDPDTDWEDKSVREMVQSIMTVSTDAANRLNEFFALFEEKVDFNETKEFKELQEFYLENISKFLKEDKAWGKEFREEEDLKVLDFDKSGLKDFETIEEDSEYELFQILDLKEEPLFSPELIRTVKIFTQFDDVKEKEKRLFLEFKKLESKDLQASSKNILNELSEDIEKFYKARFDKKENKLAKSLNKLIMALMLSSNPKNIVKGEFKKTSLLYFRDFQIFLREAFKSDEYIKAISNSCSEKELFLMSLINKFCFFLILRVSGIKQEIIGSIYRLIREGKEKKPLQNLSFWNDILEKDDEIRSYLKKCPNGPLKKLLDVLRKDEILGFDPIFQGNLPEKLYEIFIKKEKIDVLAIPSPTKQQNLLKAKIVEEFLGFLRVLKLDKKRHILFNFQDRTSLRESARVEALEYIQKAVEFKNEIEVLSLSKDSNFYHQNENFFAMSDFKDLSKELKNEILGKGDKSFFFKGDLKVKEFENFIDKIIPLIHKTFFLEKKDLARQERLDFIEIFYHFWILKILEAKRPNSFSFTCKDFVDVGSVVSFSFYSFIKLLKDSDFSKKERDFLLWMVYHKAVLVRERAVNIERLTRGLSFLALMDSHKKNLKDLFSPLYEKGFFDSMDLRIF
jgi:hypothetical protein